MITTTTHTVDGRRIRQYLGLVTGEAIMGANVIRDFMAGLTDLVGGRSGTYESKFAEARETALQEMEEEAPAQRCRRCCRYRHRLPGTRCQ